MEADLPEVVVAGAESSRHLIKIYNMAPIPSNLARKEGVIYYVKADGVSTEVVNYTGGKHMRMNPLNGPVHASRCFSHR